MGEFHSNLAPSCSTTTFWLFPTYYMVSGEVVAGWYTYWSVRHSADLCLGRASQWWDSGARFCFVTYWELWGDRWSLESNLFDIFVTSIIPNPVYQYPTCSRVGWGRIPGIDLTTFIERHFCFVLFVYCLFLYDMYNCGYRSLDLNITVNFIFGSSCGLLAILQHILLAICETIVVLYDIVEKFQIKTLVKKKSDVPPVLYGTSYLYPPGYPLGLL